MIAPPAMPHGVAGGVFSSRTNDNFPIRHTPDIVLTCERNMHFQLSPTFQHLHRHAQPQNDFPNFSLP
jgi:hypothetical protein